jgi:hypothetical protein
MVAVAPEGGGGGAVVPETVTFAAPTTPSLVALICAVPDVTPVTRPEDETGAIEVFELL